MFWFWFFPSGYFKTTWDLIKKIAPLLLIKEHGLYLILEIAIVSILVKAECIIEIGHKVLNNTKAKIYFEGSDWETM